MTRGKAKRLRELMERLSAPDNKFLQNKHNSSKQANSQISLSFYASYYTTVRLKIKALTENFHDLFNFFFCSEVIFLMAKYR